ncbi:MAG: IS4 family transposase [Bacteroidetes bacterium]|nr:IS4 family transposase [Bacteroidota bacterium]
MNQGKYVFSQVTSLLPKKAFDRLVSKYEGDKYTKHFSCWNQLMCMMYGQLGNRDSLRDLVTCIAAHRLKFHHLGFGKGVSKNNLSNANKNRDFMIFQDYAYHLVAIAQRTFVGEEDPIDKINAPVYGIDSTVIDLCLNVFWWAHFRRAKGGIKLHTVFDIKTNIPVYVFVSKALLHDVNFLDQIHFEMGSYYVFDKGYIDFSRLYKMNLSGSFFVTRAKRNLQYDVVLRSKVKKKKGIRCDQNILLKNYYALQEYPEKLRRIRFFDEEKKKKLVFLSNNFDLKAEEVAMLYKYRWRIELFFKWIKQHLKIQSFWGETENAVKVQIYIAIITYVHIAIVKRKMNTPYTNYEVLQIIGSSLLDKTDLRYLLNKTANQNFKEQNDNQLKMNLN